MTWVPLPSFLPSFLCKQYLHISEVTQNVKKVPATFNIQTFLLSSNTKAGYKVKTSRKDYFFNFKQPIKESKYIIMHINKIKKKKKKRAKRSYCWKPDAVYHKNRALVGLAVAGKKKKKKGKNAHWHVLVQMLSLYLFPTLSSVAPYLQSKSFINAVINSYVQPSA